MVTAVNVDIFKGAGDEEYYVKAIGAGTAACIRKEACETNSSVGSCVNSCVSSQKSIGGSTKGEEGARFHLVLSRW